MKDNTKESAMRSARVSPNQNQNGIKSTTETPVNVHKIAVVPDSEQPTKETLNSIEEQKNNGVTPPHPKSILRKDTRYPSPEPSTGFVDFLQRIFNPEFDSPALERTYRRYFSNQKGSSLLFLILTAIAVNLGLAILYSINFRKETLQINRIIVTAISLFINCLVLTFFICCRKRGPSPILPRIVWMTILMQLVLDLALNYKPLTPADSVGMFLFFIYLTYTLLPFRLYSCVVICLLVTVIHVGLVGILVHKDTNNLSEQVRPLKFPMRPIMPILLPCTLPLSSVGWT